jgi:hypothetical protein
VLVAKKLPVRILELHGIEKSDKRTYTLINLEKIITTAGIIDISTILIRFIMC